MFLRRRRANGTIREGTPGTLDGYIVGSGLIRYLLRQRYDQDDPNLPEFFKNYGMAHIYDVKFHHLQQALDNLHGLTCRQS